MNDADDVRAPPTEKAEVEATIVTNNIITDFIIVSLLNSNLSVCGPSRSMCSRMTHVCPASWKLIKTNKVFLVRILPEFYVFC